MNLIKEVDILVSKTRISAFPQKIGMPVKEKLPSGKFQGLHWIITRIDPWRVLVNCSMAKIKPRARHLYYIRSDKL